MEEEERLRLIPACPRRRAITQAHIDRGNRYEPDLYGAPLSPFVRKVRLLLAEKGLDYQLEAIAPFGQPAWYREISPLGRIPALRDGDLALADSSVICQYLEERYPEPPNLQGDARQPRSGALAGKIRRLRDRSPGHADDLPQPDTRPAMGQACEENDVRRALEEKLPAHFDYLENHLDGRAFFVGERLTLADLAIASQLVNLRHAGENLDEQRWPALAAHFARMLERPAMQALLPGERRTLDKLAAKA